MSDLLRPVRTSIGSKFLVGLTGLALVGFVLGHMSGNLLVFAGPDALNSYAQKLKSLGPLLWVVRAGLLAVFVLHVALALRLTAANRAARPDRYVYDDVLQASWASRHMWLTGLALLAFLAYHLAHFTLGLTHAAETQSTPSGPVLVDKHYLDLTEVKQGGKTYVPAPSVNLSAHGHGDEYRHDVYSMVVSGFKVPYIAGLYLVSMLLLALHLWHGASSMFQSLGASSAGWKKWLVYVGPAVAAAVLLGNCSIVVAVMSGLIK
ncbi:MAG: succinate dehydrogenase cytochrome b subunit [Gemmataceae bacterium]